jgi:hypothetical protein
MKLDLPDHPVGLWRRTPPWLFWKPRYRRKHWRWLIDHRGCECIYVWEYRWTCSLRDQMTLDSLDPPEGMVAA